MDQTTALKNRDIRHLYETWIAEFGNAGFDWSAVQGTLKKSIDPIVVININSSSQDILDFSSSNYPEGRSLIAVGGLGLSRGLTLEGLLVSYFLRNSIMYDTLMQMGRWFGYREGYADLCRVFMTGQAESWYSHITEATEELREDFRSMEKSMLTPLEFGLRVRSHPTSLIVTARNKMRKGSEIPHKISLEGRLIETIALKNEEASKKHNICLINEIVLNLQKDSDAKYRRTNLGHEWGGVSFDYITSFIERFTNHPQSFYTFYSGALVEYIALLKDEYDCGVVLLKTLGPKNDDPILPVGSDLKGSIQNRDKTAHITESLISFKKNARLGEPKDEAAGLTDLELKALKPEIGSQTINPRAYRSVEGKKPLLILHLLKLPSPHKVVAGYGISFPGSATSRRMGKLVEYVVNIQYWNKKFGDSGDDEEDKER